MLHVLVDHMPIRGWPGGITNSLLHPAGFGICDVSGRALCLPGRVHSARRDGRRRRRALRSRLAQVCRDIFSTPQDSPHFRGSYTHSLPNQPQHRMHCSFFIGLEQGCCRGAEELR